MYLGKVLVLGYRYSKCKLSDADFSVHPKWWREAVHCLSASGRTAKESKDGMRDSVSVKRIANKPSFIQIFFHAKQSKFQ